MFKDNKLNEKFSYDRGFHGCIASFYMNQTNLIFTKSIYQNLMSIAIAHDGVVEGCQKDSQHQIVCLKNTCYSGGRCIQQWSRIRCDCTMTTFIGERCDKG